MTRQATAGCRSPAGARRRARAAGWRRWRSRSSGSARRRRTEGRRGVASRCPRSRACPAAVSARPGSGRPWEPLELGSSRRPHRESGCRRLPRHARLQPPDDLDGDLVRSSCRVIAELLGERKWRPIIGRSDAEPPKAVGHDADDLVRGAVDRPRGGRSPPDRPGTACAIPRDSARSPAVRHPARRRPAATGARARPGPPAPERSSR